MMVTGLNLSLNDAVADDKQSPPTQTKVKKTKDEKAARKAQRAADEKRKADEKTADEYTHYVHLANGDVVRVKEENLPGHFGADQTAPYGHYETGGHVHVVTGIYPRETKQATEEKK